MQEEEGGEVRAVLKVKGDSVGQESEVSSLPCEKQESDPKTTNMAATTQLRLTNEMVKPFNGEGDVMAWLAKIELVASLMKVQDVSKFIPLYLEGGALAVYLEMPEQEKGNVELLKLRLQEAFTDSQFVAFEKLKSAKWAGEPVDVFAMELRKLGRKSGMNGDGLEQLVKLAFVTGFPDSIGIELQQVQGVNAMTVSDIMSRARVLAAGKAHMQGIAAPAVDKASRKIKCFNCSLNHPIRFCPELKSANRSSAERKDVKCFRCSGPHLLRNCPEVREAKRPDGTILEDEKRPSCASGCPLKTVSGPVQKVPIIDILVNGEKGRALVDTGCTSSMVRHQLVKVCEGETAMMAFDGREVRCRGTSEVELVVGDETLVQRVTVVEKIVGNVDLVLGMDVIKRLGGVSVGNNQVQFGRIACAVACEKEPDITDKDFEAFFDGKRWTVRYFWKNGEAPKLHNSVSEYKRDLDESKLQSYEEEIERWIAEGILAPWYGKVESIVPLMAVEQPTKGKVRPVLDFRAVNEFVECHTGDDVTDVCSDRIREWRQVEGEAEIVDLKAAYLQIKVVEELWQYQLVEYKGRTYCLTRLGFGLNAAPRIMTKILKTVLAKDQKIKQATSSYIDDIMVDVSRVSAESVVKHLGEYGLTAKPPEKLDEGAALGLKLKKGSQGKLMFSRANEVPEVNKEMTRKELFSVCGKLVGHYPMAGWLRLACSYVKRHAEGTKWTDYVGEVACNRAEEMINAVKLDDPVRGQWKVNRSRSGTVWCDASDIGMGVLVEIDGVAVEDMSWMRKKDDYTHINVAELEAVLKGINLGVKWGLTTITIRTDSATVFGWIQMTLSEEKKVKTRGAAEILVKRRLGILKSMIHELGLTVMVQFVKSEANKADVLTRVKKSWLVEQAKSVACVGFQDVKQLHDRHHMGVERTWYLAKKVDPSVDKDTVKKVVRQCGQCQSIDPAPASHTPGELCVDQSWQRLAIDVTHYRNVAYLSMVDCGPGRFAIWRQLKNETAEDICKELNQLFYERGPVRELLMDNALAFKSKEMSQLLNKWNIQSFFRAAYRASGNGIVERHHRTIKAMAERGDVNPVEAVYWYNMSPRDGQKDGTVPQKSIFDYEWRQPGVQPDISVDEAATGKIVVGDEVWVKPPQSRCTTKWKKGEVTSVNSANNVEVDGVPRHILDVRRVEGTENDGLMSVADDDNLEMSINQGVENGESRYPERARRPPRWLDEYSRD